jgi:hypothetical protein
MHTNEYMSVTIANIRNEQETMERQIEAKLEMMERRIEAKLQETRAADLED